MILRLLIPLVVLCLALNPQTKGCNAPKKITIATVSSCSVAVNWSKVAGADHYKVSFKGGGMMNWSPPVKVFDTTYLFSNLFASTFYNFKVIAVCTDGTNSKKKT